MSHDIPKIEVAELVAQAMAEANRQRGRLNLIVAGRSGVGKSTLINAVFGEELVATGQGRPVTLGVSEIHKEGLPISIWDTRGVEMEGFQETHNQLEKLIQERQNDPDPNRHIHAAWLCIQEDIRRVEDGEVKLHETLSKYLPVIGVITKARNDDGFKATVEKLLPQVKAVARVRALSETFDDGHVIKPAGVVELVELTDQLLPERHRDAFVAAQKASIELKETSARKHVRASATLAAATGASPVPFADAPILIGIQVRMLAKISSSFGLTGTEALLGNLVAAFAGTSAATIAGRTLVSGLLKFIPGAGTAIGGIISGGVAASITTGLGELYISVLKYLSENNPNPGEPLRGEDVADEFRRRLSSGTRQAS